MKIVHYGADDNVDYGNLKSDDTIRKLANSPFEDLNASDNIRHPNEVPLPPPGKNHPL